MADFIIVTPDIVGPVKNGGIGTGCYHYARSLANAGWSVAILFTGLCPAETIPNWRVHYRQRGITFLTMADVPGLPQPLYGNRWYSERALALYRYLRTRDDRCILFQDWHGNGFWSVRARLLGTDFSDRTIGVIAHSPTKWQKAGMLTFGESPLDEANLHWIEQEAIAGADVLISPSQHMVSWLEDNGFKLPARVEICPYTFEDSATGPPLGPPDLTHLMFFGRLETRKGLHLLGRALKEMSPVTRPRRVSFLGKHARVDGQPSEVYLAALQAELPDVHFTVNTDLDYVGALATIKAQNGLVVMPSTLDNLPLTVIESIVNGISFMASDVGGIPEAVDPRVLFQPTPASLTAALERRSDIDFMRLRHGYSRDHAREIWLETTTDLLRAPICASITAPAPAIGASRRGVSICIPFYHHDRFINRLLNALLATADEDTQFVFVNDGTPEADCPRFLSFAKRLQPLGHIFHTQENAGPGAARNKAISLAHHERIIFFDSDNVPMPRLVPALTSALAASGADIVSAPFIAVPAMLRAPTPSDALYHYHPPGGCLSMALIDNVLGDTCCITTRSVMEALGGFETRRMYTEDWEFYLRAKGRGFWQLVYTEPLFYYTFEDNVRRSETGDYINRHVLWSSFETMQSDILAQTLRDLLHQVYVKNG
jgi:glycosyltransferase involved in cell wall biosynthesis/GT2 family glycosyltransferase